MFTKLKRFKKMYITLTLHSKTENKSTYHEFMTSLNII